MALTLYEKTELSVPWQGAGGQFRLSRIPENASFRAVRALLLETIYAGSNCKINEDFCAQK